MITVGKVRDAHGLKGELFVILFAGKADWADSVKKASLVRRERVKRDDGKEETVEKSYEFPIKRLKVHKKGIIVKVEGLGDRTEAESFSGALFQIANEALVSKPGERVYLKELEGFEVVDAVEGSMGKVIGFSSNGAQDLLVVSQGDTQVEVPLVPDFIKKLDFKTKVIEMTLPPGLLISQSNSNEV